MKVELVTKSKYAEMRGCAPSAVTRAVKEGRITIIKDAGGREMIDPAVADIQWARNTRARVDSSPALVLDPERPTRQADRPAERPLPDGANDDQSYWSARSRREAAEAAIAEMKLAEMEGRLISADAMRGAWATKIAAARDAILQIPARLAPILAAESDLIRITALLDAELRQALSDLSGQSAPPPAVQH